MLETRSKVSTRPKKEKKNMKEANTMKDEKEACAAMLCFAHVFGPGSLAAFQRRSQGALSPQSHLKLNGRPCSTQVFPSVLDSHSHGLLSIQSSQKRLAQLAIHTNLQTSFAFKDSSDRKTYNGFPQMTGTLAYFESLCFTVWMHGAILCPLPTSCGA